MSEHLTPEDRDRLRALAEKATPGPWLPHARYVWTEDLGGIIQNWSDDANAAADMEFIAAAHTAVPALLDQLDQTEAERGGAIRALNEHLCEGSAERAYARTLAAEAERDQARAQVDRVRELHQPVTRDECCTECSCGHWSHTESPTDAEAVAYLAAFIEDLPPGEDAEWTPDTIARVKRGLRATRRDEEKRASCGCDLTGLTPPAVHLVDDHEGAKQRLAAQEPTDAEWENEVAAALPERYDGDGDQRAIILRAVRDMAARETQEPTDAEVRAALGAANRTALSGHRFDAPLRFYADNVVAAMRAALSAARAARRDEEKQDG